MNCKKTKLSFYCRRVNNNLLHLFLCFKMLEYRTVSRALHTTWWRLHAGGGIGKARTRANDDVTCSVSDENAPPLA